MLINKYINTFFKLTVVCCLFVFPQMSQAQQFSRTLWEPVSDLKKMAAEDQQHRLVILKQENIDFSAVFKTTELTGEETVLAFSFLGEQVRIQRSKLDQRAHDNFSWFGSNADKSIKLHFVMHRNLLTGTLEAYGEIYELHPLGEGMVICIQYEASSMGGCGTEEHAEKTNDTFLQQQNKLPSSITEDIEINGDRSAPGCKLRVLIGFTRQAAILTQDLYGFAQNLIDDHNINLSNSQINHQAELARVVEFPNYNETNDGQNNATQYLEHFYKQGGSNHHMDDVFNERGITNADICVLIYSHDTNSDICGEAVDVGSTWATAFAVVRNDCAIGVRGFSHEVGHLFFCSHDPYVAPPGYIPPYANGQGYVYPSEGWRTIMSYPNLCTDSGVLCSILGIYCTPYVDHPFFGTPLGTLDAHDNALVINITGPTVMGFETIPHHKTLVANRTIKDDEFISVKAKNTITLDGGVITFKEDAYGEFVSKEKIILRNGGKITYENGNNGKVDISTEDPCVGIARQQERVTDGSKIVTEKPLLRNQIENGQLQLSPNPFQQQLKLTYQSKNTTLGKVTFSFYDLHGRLLDAQQFTSAPNGQIIFDWQPPDFYTDQIIILEILDGDSRLMEKLLYLKGK